MGFYLILGIIIYFIAESLYRNNQKEKIEQIAKKWLNENAVVLSDSIQSIELSDFENLDKLKKIMYFDEEDELYDITIMIPQVSNSYVKLKFNNIANVQKERSVQNLPTINLIISKLDFDSVKIISRFNYIQFYKPIFSKNKNGINKYYLLAVKYRYKSLIGGIPRIS